MDNSQEDGVISYRLSISRIYESNLLFSALFDKIV